MADFYAFVKECLTIIVPAILAYIAWRQREGDLERERQGMKLKAVQRDVADVKYTSMVLQTRSDNQAPNDKTA